MKTQRPNFFLRRFSILYMGFTVLPMLILFYLYTLYGDSKTIIGISKDHFTLLIILLGVTALAGFFSMHFTLARFVSLAENIRKTAFEKVDEKVILKLIHEEGEVAELAKSFAQILKRLDDNVQELEETKKTLSHLMAKISNVLSSVENLDSLVQLVLETTIDALGVNRGALFSCDNGRYLLRSTIGTGADATPDRVMTAARPFLELTEKENRVFVLPSLAEDDTWSSDLFSLPLICSPLIYRGKNWGALLLCGKRRGNNFTEDDLSIAANLSNQIAIAFENARLNADAEQTYFETMAALAMAVEARDAYSRGHSDRVGEYARKIGLKMGLPEESIKILRDASRLHDVGKIGIMDSVLVKPGSLNAEEREVMNKHPIIGESILMPLKTFKPLLDPIRHHHEHLDGSGYPDGLRGDQLSLVTRVLSVADIFDALATDRPYRKAMAPDLLRETFDRFVADGKIDGEVVSSLYRLLEDGGFRIRDGATLSPSVPAAQGAPVYDPLPAGLAAGSPA